MGGGRLEGQVHERMEAEGMKLHYKLNILITMANHAE